jgi:hypothetical protein
MDQCAELRREAQATEAKLVARQWDVAFLRVPGDASDR